MGFCNSAPLESISLEALAVLQGSVAYLGTLEYTLDLLDSEGEL